MKITLTLSEILEYGNWDLYCQKTGTSEWIVNEGGGHIEKTLTPEECQKYQISLLGYPIKS